MKSYDEIDKAIAALERQSANDSDTAKKRAAVETLRQRDEKARAAVAIASDAYATALFAAEAEVAKGLPVGTGVAKARAALDAAQADAEIIRRVFVAQSEELRTIESTEAARLAASVTEVYAIVLPLVDDRISEMNRADALLARLHHFVANRLVHGGRHVHLMGLCFATPEMQKHWRDRIAERGFDVRPAVRA